MRANPVTSGVRGAALGCCLAAVVFFAPGAALASFVGSYHDFSADPLALAAPWKGPCTPCHVPHGSTEALLLWPRSLTQERAVLRQIDAPDYLPDTTLACYDCHDDNAETISPAIDADPVKTSWTNNEWPQDIAFTDDAFSQGGVKVGYYELYDGRMAPQDATAPIDGSATGGHYWKRPTAQLSGTPQAEQGDKIECSLCHDPHNSRTGFNEAFFRTQTTDGGGGTVNLGDGLKASDQNDLTNPNRSRNGTGTGREMCAACHAYSNFGSPQTLWGAPVPAPTVNVAQHQRDDTTACVKCHQHNRINASCRECHGFPPLNASPWNRLTNPDGQSAAYTGVSGTGAHQRHKDALGDLVFNCDICHGPGAGSASWHNQGNGTVFPAFVDVMGRLDYWGAGSAYRGTNLVAGPTGYAFAAKGGGDQRCAGLACHGAPPDLPGALNWTDDMVDGDGWRPLDGLPEPGTGTFVGTTGDDVCKWCHDATPARIGPSGPVAPNVMGTGGAPTAAANWGAEVNGHGLSSSLQYDKSVVAAADGNAGAGKDCDVCHDARYRVNPAPPPANIPWNTHFDGVSGTANKRLKGTNGTTINGLAAASADAVCAACHQFVGPASGQQMSSHGNDTGGGYLPLEPNFCRSCRQCHDVHGATWNGTTKRNIYMVGSWLDLDDDGVTDPGEEARVDSDAVNMTEDITSADAPVVFTGRTGVDSYDTDDGTPENNVCLTCHVPSGGGGSGTGGGLHDGTLSPFDMRGSDCMECHDHDFDDKPETCDGIAPSTCEGCHGGRPGDTAGKTHLGRDNTAGTDDDAPNVTMVNVSGNWVSVWNGDWWDTQRGGGAAQQGGHGDPDGVENGGVTPVPICTRCHNIADPPGRHLDGTFTSLGSELPRSSGTPSVRPKGAWGGSGTFPNSNNAHLLPAFFTEFPANGAGSWSQQVAMDNYCYSKCHAGNGVQDMRHERDTAAGEANHGSVELGTHLTRAALSDPTDYIMDADVTSAAGAAPHYAPCVSCHNPHGSTNTDTKGSGPGASNHMLIDNWQKDATLCSGCHQ